MEMQWISWLIYQKTTRFKTCISRKNRPSEIYQQKPHHLVRWVILLQYPALCVSFGLPLACVRACSSWLSSGFRVSCKLSAEASIVLTAPAASDRKEGKPRSIPAAVPTAALLEIHRRKTELLLSRRFLQSVTAAQTGTKKLHRLHCDLCHSLLPSSSDKKKKKKKSQDTLSSHKQQVILIPEGETSFFQMDGVHSDVPPALPASLPACLYMWLWSLPSRGKRRPLSPLVGKHGATFHHHLCAITERIPCPVWPRRPAGQASIRDKRSRMNVRKQEERNLPPTTSSGVLLPNTGLRDGFLQIRKIQPHEKMIGQFTLWEKTLLGESLSSFYYRPVLVTLQWFVTFWTWKREFRHILLMSNYKTKWNK